MPDISVEEAVNQNCQAIMSGDLMRVMGDFTPDALAALMTVGSGLNVNALPALHGYEIESHEQEGADHNFVIKFRTSDGEVTAHATWRDIDGFWKIAAITLEGLPT